MLTGPHGEFDLGALDPGDYSIKIATVGYRLVQTRIEVKSGDSKELDIALSPDTFQRTEHIEVRADPFDTNPRTGAAEFSIDGAEAKNLAGVLADDPLRAVQSMPGVSSNDDFDSRFSIHGAPYERVGLYLDGILLHTPFHTVQGEGPTGSLTVFNGDMIDNMSLQSEGYSAKYDDRTAGILDVRTRDGSRTGNSFRITAGAPDAGVMGEGPLGSDHQGSWLASVRKSYLQYLVHQTADQTAMAFGFTDSQVQLSYDLGRSHTVRLKMLDGTSGLDRSDARDTLSLNSSMLAAYHFTLANLEWQYAPNPSLLVTTHAAFMRERYDDTNRGRNGLSQGFYGEWVGKTDVTWMWSRTAAVDFGISARRIRGEGFSDYYENGIDHLRVEGHRGNETLLGGYAQQSWTGFGKRLTLVGGVRSDCLVGHALACPATSPQASLAFLPARATHIQVNWGQYAQFPDVQSQFSIYGGARLRPERSTHYSVSIEQRLGAMSRLRIQAYQRNDRDLLFRPMQEARLLPGGSILPDNFQAPIENSLRGYSRGVEFFLQRRTANRLTGWVSYSLGFARMRDGITGMRFWSDQDQRHTANAYLGYRIRPSVNLSTRWTYGSGFPIPGFFQVAGGQYVIAPVRNAARIDPFQRLDVRVNKSKTFEHAKMTIYAEVVNLLNRPNYRFDSYNGYGPAGQAYISLSNMFPILPAGGVMLEF
jgi:hypothetical protein